MEKFFVEVKNEFDKIDKKWLDLHFKTLIWVIIVAFIVECSIGYLMYLTGEISSSIPKFIFKFVVVPVGLNFIIGLINYRVIKSMKVSQKSKIYVTSLSMVCIFLVIYTVHGVFTALYVLFVIPILMTTIYVDYRLTTITSIVSVTGLIISELFIKWDVDKESIMSSGIGLGNFFISLIVLIWFCFICMLVVQFEKHKNEASFQKEIEKYKLQKRLQIDELTGIYNRFGFKNAFQDMEEDKSGSSYIYAMIDIDNFKTLNDSMGHVTGDHCLVELGNILRKNSMDAIPIRYGGDEFGIIFRNKSTDEVIKICEQIQKDFAAAVIDGKKNLPLSMSVGIAQYSCDMTLSTLIIHTDQALYESKKEKNKITVYNNNAVKKVGGLG